MNKAKTSLNQSFPNATVFVSSACVMILEIAAGRMAAIQFGSSLYAWTSVIGVTLAGLTVGNYAGGQIADRFSLRKSIGWLFALCSGGCVAAVALNNLAGDWSILWRLDPAIQVTAFITIVFFVPSALIGAISPVAVKMALASNQHEGRTVGRMYAFGAAGSILGTFLAGFWLIATIGTTNTIWVVVTVMLLGALFYLPKSRAIYIYGAIIVLLITAGTIPSGWAVSIGSAIGLRHIEEPDLIYETESQYCYIAVRQISRQPDERQFIEDNMMNHSRVIMGRIRDFRLFYPQVYAWVTQETAKGKEKLSTLSIGGGGYVFPRYILDVWPGSRVDVAEIDPSVTRAAKLAFGLPRETPIQTINLDGRNYVDELLEKKSRGEVIPQYDFVYMDAFNDMAVPYQMVTRQFNDKIFTILASDGVYLVNMIDLFESGKFLASYINTLRQTFPYVYVVKRPSRDDLPNNFIIIAGKMPLDLRNSKNAEFPASFPLLVMDDNDLDILNKKPGWTILDDDYVPVENLMAPVVRSKTAATASEKCINQADELCSLGQLEKAASMYRMAIQICPAVSTRVYYLTAGLLADNGKLGEAADVLRSGLVQSEIENDKDALLNIHHKLGIVLKKSGDSEEAARHFADAIEIIKNDIGQNGGSATQFAQLGQLEAESGNMKEAQQNFKKALAEDPANFQYHQQVAESLLFEGLKEEAARQLNESIQYMLNEGRKADADKLKEMLRRIEAEK